MDKMGGGERIIFNNRLIVTGTSRNISTTQFELFNKTNFTNLTFINNLSSVIVFDENTGIFEFKTSGILKMQATLNILASQASAILYMIPEFNFGDGWVTATPRKEVCVAIQCCQISWAGELEIFQGSKARFNFKGESGNLTFVTNTLDPGGQLECILPACVFYADIIRKTLKRFA